MEVFWDTSGLVATLLKEPGTSDALRAWGQTSRVWCWRWLQVEMEAALSRRSAPGTAWAQWRKLAGAIDWLDFDHAQYPALCAFNRPLRLRAADAGHLFVCDRAASTLPSLHLYTQDKEMAVAANTLGLSLLAP